MELTNAEKLSLLMLADIYQSLDISRGSVDPAFVREAIVSGNAWALSRQYRGSSYASEDHSEEAVDHVYDVLVMWSILEESFGDLTPKDKERVKQENYGKPVQISGFDGHEDQLGIVRFIIQHMDGFKSLTGRADIDSHSPTEQLYARMVTAFKPIHERIAAEMRHPVRLTADEILEVLKARRWRERASP